MSKLFQHWFSYGLIVIWFVIWLLVQKSDLMEQFTGKGMNLIGNQYYRFGTALFLHKDLFHVVANAVALYWVGVYLEPQSSSARLCVFALFMGALSQFFFGVIYRESTSFGGSPIVFALIGLIIAWNVMKAGNTRFQLGTWYGNWILGYAVLSNLPFFGNGLSALVIHSISLVLGALFGGIAIGLRFF